MSWSVPPDPHNPNSGGQPPRPGDPGWVQVPPDQWPGSTPPASGTNPPPVPPWQPPPAQPAYTVQPAGYQSPYPYVAPKRSAIPCGGLGCVIALIVIVSVVVPIILIVASFGSFGGDFFGQIGQAVNSVLNVNATLGLSTTTAPGNAAAYDPFAALPAVAAFAGDGAQLAEIEAAQVRSDGTQDLTADYEAPRPRTTYTFFREVPRPENAPPVGAGGTTDGPWYEPITVEAYRPGEMSQIRRTGGGVSISTQFVNQGLKRQVQDPTTSLAFVEGFVAPPACTTRQLWSTALERGAPSTAVATITYNSDGYEFSIPGAGFRLEFSADCRAMG